MRKCSQTTHPLVVGLPRSIPSPVCRRKVVIHVAGACHCDCPSPLQAIYTVDGRRNLPPPHLSRSERDEARHMSVRHGVCAARPAKRVVLACIVAFCLVGVCTSYRNVFVHTPCMSQRRELCALLVRTASLLSR